MYEIRIIDEGVTNKPARRARNGGKVGEAKTFLTEEVDKGNTNDQPDSWASTVALTYALKGTKVNSAIIGGRVAIGSSNIVFDLLKGAKNELTVLGWNS